MKLLFTGDVNFRGLLLDSEKSEKIIPEVKPYFEESNFNIVNLETPLADKEKHKPILKSGPNLISPPENIVFLKALGVDVVTFANNHTGDWGEGAVSDTLNLLSENNIACCGAGENIHRAYDAVRLEKDGVSVSIISVCENEFGMATENSYGSAGYNARLLLAQIKKEKEISRYVVVVFHGGHEFNPLPSPDTQDRYRLICDMGADAVIAGHTHCPQGYEIYGGKPIIYSMGNFLFRSGGGLDGDWSSERSSDNSWYYGYMTALKLGNSNISIEIIPYKYTESPTVINVFTEECRSKMLEYIENLSSIIRNPEMLKNYYKGWAYLHQWFPKIDDQKSMDNLNLARCESYQSQTVAALEFYAYNELESAKHWAEEITKLQKMPV